jgi:hypothetical protein
MALSLQSALSAVIVGGAMLGGAGCGSASIPEPREAAMAYADAAAKGDADALYEMLSDKGKKVRTREEVRALVADQRTELSDQAKQVRGDDARIKTEATVRYGDGEEAALALEEGAFRVSAADALPAEARTPVQALDQLRRVLARRSYAGLIRVLSPRTRAALEADLRSLVEGLEEPSGLDVDVTGDTAIVVVPGGHLVRLRREGGAWHVEDFLSFDSVEAPR